MTEINWFSCKLEVFDQAGGRWPRQFYCVSKDHMKRFEPAMLLSQLTLAASNAPAWKDRPRYVDPVWEKNWATVAEEDSQERMKNKWKTSVCSHTEKQLFPCCCGDLRDTGEGLRFLPTETLHLPARACSCKRVLIPNQKSTFIRAYRAWGVCLHLHSGLPPPHLPPTLW